MKSEIRDVAVENLSAKEVEIPIMICGFRQKGITKRVKNISLKNINLELSRVPDTVDRRLFIPEYTTEYPECKDISTVHSYEIIIFIIITFLQLNSSFAPAGQAVPCKLCLRGRINRIADSVPYFLSACCR